DPSDARCLRRGGEVWRLVSAASTWMSVSRVTALATDQQHPCRLLDLTYHPAHFKVRRGPVAINVFDSLQAVTGPFAATARDWHILCLGMDERSRIAQCKPKFS